MKQRYTNTSRQDSEFLLGGLVDFSETGYSPKEIVRIVSDLS